MTAHFSLLAAAITSTTMAFAMSAFARTTLTVCATLETDQTKAYQDTFEETNPDIEIKWVHDSIGVITAKLLARKSNPRADMVWGLAISSLVILDKEGMLTSYTPVDLAKIGAACHDKINLLTWVGMGAWGAAICFSIVEAQKQDPSKSASWADLTKPVYVGKIAIPSPTSPGIGYLDISAWLQVMGEQKDWTYMDAPYQSVGQYTHSGSKLYKMAVSDESPIDIVSEYHVVKSKKEGALIDTILPSEGLGWDVEVTGIIKGTKNFEAAKGLADFSANPTTMALYKKNFAMIATPGFSKSDPLLPTNHKKHLIRNDFAWASTNRDRILAEWTKRYDSKSEKK